MNNLYVSLIHTSYPNHRAIIQRVLTEFEAQKNIQIELDSHVWETARNQLVEYALHKTGPVISEIGTTWLSSLVSMNVLLKLDRANIRRLVGSDPLQRVDIQTLTDPDTYVPSAWNSVVALDDQIWAIPWTGDTRLIYYRRDLLQKAGVDEASAFESAAAWQNTLAQLKAAGEAVPILLNTVREPALLQKAASWVWAAGGRFMEKGGRRTSFNTPEAKAGFYDYFKTFAPYLPPPMQNISEDRSSEMFREGTGAMIVTGQWLLSREFLERTIPEVRENLGIAMLPVIPYAGGSHLVIWQHGIDQLTEGLMLIEALTSESAQMRLALEGMVLPSRRSVLDSPSFKGEFGYDVISRSLQRGKAFEAAYLWGLVEDRLIAFVHEIWQQLFADPQLDLEGVMDKKLTLLAKRLDTTLGR